MAGEKYTYGIDFDALDAIDIHAHVEADDHGQCAYDDELITATKQYFKLDSEPTTVDSVAEYYRQRNTAAVVFTIDSQTVSGHPPNSVENLIEGAARNNDILIPFGSVDPLTGDRAVRGVRKQIELGVKGFKFHPSLQGFEPDDRAYYPIYSAIAEAGVPALFHTGQTGIGSGLPGGHGVKLRYSDPMLLDDVAADFPQLTIVMAHPAVPWIDAQISIAQHKANVYVDLSGWSPKYFPPQLVRSANRQLRTKVLFGTDYPYIEVDRWRRDFEALDMKPEVLPLIFKENALRVLGSLRDEFLARRRSVSVTDPSAQGEPIVPIRQGAPVGAPTWIDLSTSDLERAKQFYGNVFGWTFETAGPEYGGYVNAFSGGHPVAGLMHNDPQWNSPDGWTTYLHTADIKATLATAIAAGAVTCVQPVEPIEVPDKGWMAMVSDPAGAFFGLWQPIKHYGFEVFGEAGAPIYHQLTAHDYAKALDFYRQVFDWHVDTVSDTDEFRYSTASFDGEALVGIMDGTAILPEGAPSNWVFFLGSDDVDKTVALVEDNGGSVVRDAEDTSYGRLAAVADPTGAGFNLSSLE